MKLKITIFITFLLLLKNFAFSQETEWSILKVISEPENNSTYKIHLVLENEMIERIKIQGISEEFNFSFEKINGGMVILRREERDVLILVCPSCDTNYGGEIEVRYLKNALKGLYSEIYIDLRKHEGRWGLFSPLTNRPIKSVVLKSNKLLGKIIGIKNIEINP